MSHPLVVNLKWDNEQENFVNCVELYTCNISYTNFTGTIILISQSSKKKKKRTRTHNNSYINHDVAEANEIIVAKGSRTPALVTQSLHSLGIASTRQPTLHWSQMAKINIRTDPVKSRNTSAPLSRQQFRWSLQSRPPRDLALSSKRINCCRSSGLKAETELGVNSTLIDEFSPHMHLWCSEQSTPNLEPLTPSKHITHCSGWQRGKNYKRKIWASIPENTRKQDHGSNWKGRPRKRKELSRLV